VSKEPSNPTEDDRSTPRPTDAQSPDRLAVTGQASFDPTSESQSELTPIPSDERAVHYRSYEGPIPAEQLRDYDDVWPQFGKRYLKSLDDESSHRRAFEYVATLAPYIAGLLYAAMAFGCGLLFLRNGQPDLGAWIIGAVVVGGIVAFLRQTAPTGRPDDEA